MIEHSIQSNFEFLRSSRATAEEQKARPKPQRMISTVVMSTMEGWLINSASPELRKSKNIISRTTETPAPPKKKKPKTKRPAASAEQEDEPPAKPNKAKKAKK